MGLGIVARGAALLVNTAGSSAAVCRDHGSHRDLAAHQGHRPLINSCDNPVLPAPKGPWGKPLQSPTDSSAELQRYVLDCRAAGCIWLLLRMLAQPISSLPLATPDWARFHARRSRSERTRFALSGWTCMVVSGGLAR